MRRFTVAGITAELDRLLQSRYPLLEVVGEVAQVYLAGSGHAYLTLREGDGRDTVTLAAVAFRDDWRRFRFRPTDGDKIIARGALSVYGRKGQHQLRVLGIERHGDGGLAAELRRRKARLEAEGLLDPRRKRPLPQMPRIVGVATSLQGAALQDFLKVSGSRFPGARVLVAGCTVQGATAAGSVIQALDLLLEDGRAEVLVVTRGGGSKEDLMAFQDEGLARFIGHAPVPVISAVGHQVDTTLCDLVADAVAPTPTAAAVQALPDRLALAQRIDDAERALSTAVRRSVERRADRVRQLRARLRHPGERLVEVRRRADQATRRLHTLMQTGLRDRRRAVDPLESRLGASVGPRVARARRDTADLQERLAAALRRQLPTHRARLALIEERLHGVVEADLRKRRERVDHLLGQADALSPAAVLRRGYAVVVGPSGVVTGTADVAAGDVLDIRVQDGIVPAVVQQTREDP